MPGNCSSRERFVRASSAAASRALSSIRSQEQFEFNTDSKRQRAGGRSHLLQSSEQKDSGLHSRIGVPQEKLAMPGKRRCIPLKSRCTPKRGRKLKQSTTEAGSSRKASRKDKQLKRLERSLKFARQQTAGRSELEVERVSRRHLASFIESELRIPRGFSIQSVARGVDVLNLIPPRPLDGWNKFRGRVPSDPTSWLDPGDDGTSGVLIGKQRPRKMADLESHVGFLNMFLDGLLAMDFEHA